MRCAVRRYVVHKDSQCNFDESDENADADKVEPIAPQQLLGMLFAQAPPAAADGGDDDEGEDDGEAVRDPA